MSLHAAKHWSRWALFVAFWTIVGLAFASQFYLSSLRAGWPVTWEQALFSSLADWYVFALLSIPTIKLARAFPFERRNWLAIGVVHLLASILLSFGYIAVRAFVAQIHSWNTPEPLTFGRAFTPLLAKPFQYYLWVFWVIMAVSHAFDYYQKYHQHALQASELEKSLAQAKLRALQSQLNPHFLFNTLHTISALMHKDVDAADRMIMKLSELLRLALDNTDTHEVPLIQEIDFLKRYLEIEQTRFRWRLAVDLQIAPDTLQASVPNLVLQPLVENAIRHGIERHARPGRIVLRSKRQNGQLHLEVQDNGGGLPGGKLTREGIGLSNTRRRLEQLYGANHKFELQNVDSGGLLARITIPFHTVHAKES
jgi:two-component system, LytTR family, sensor kinase